MNPMPLPNEPVDELLSDYFKSAMPKPWPAAPRLAEPSQVAAARTEPGRRARFTLAASVAIMVGACWYFASAPQPAARTRPGAEPMLPDGSATTPKEFKRPAPPPMLD